MKFRRCIGVIGCSLLAALTMRAGAAEWNLVRFESREYVTLDNLAQFYGFPKPAPVDLTGHFSPSSPLVVGAFPAGVAPAPSSPSPAASAPVPGLPPIAS